MIRNTLIAFVRSLRRNRVNTLVHILGLSTGIAAALVLGLFAHHELSYDKFHENKEQLYMVYKERITPNGVQPAYDTWVPMLEQMQLDFPEILTGTRVFNDNVLVNINDLQFDDRAMYVDSTFFDVFSFGIVHGNASKPFENASSAVITEETAIKYFGSTDVIGEVIRIDFQNTYKISAVAATPPANSSIQFDVLTQLHAHPAYEQVAESWGGSFINTWIVLNPEAEVEHLTNKFPAFIEKIWDEETRARTNFRLLPLLASYDTFIGDADDAYVLIIIAVGILLIACINFINLSTATSTDRAREIGMRKTMGSASSQLIGTFLTESVLLTVISTVLGVTFAKLIIPTINSMFSMEMALPIGDVRVMLVILGFAVILGVLSGFYPAFFLSRFAIIPSLKGNLKAGGQGIRKMLVILQFTLSTTLIIIAIIMWSQLNYMSTKDLAYDKEHLIIIPVSTGNFEDRDDASVRIQSFRDVINSSSLVVSSSTSTHIPSRWSGSNTFVQPSGWEGDPLRMRFTYHDAAFFNTYGINVLQGEGFLPDSAGNQRGSVVLNEAAAEAFGFDDISEKSIQIGNNTLDVVGLIQNFNFETLRSSITPILHFHRVPSNGVHNYITVKTRPGQGRELITFLEEQWKMVSDTEPFSYFFLEESLAEMYAAENRLLSMVTIFTLVTIFIACLGLYGLSAFVISKRAREMGIRKVLGASTSQLYSNVTRSFGLYIIAGFLVSLPLAYGLSNAWLADYAFQVEVNIWMYLMALAGSLAVGLITVTYKAMMVAHANPVKTLREE